MVGQSFVVFVDYNKAFDNTSQVYMFYIMLEIGLSQTSRRSTGSALQ